MFKKTYERTDGFAPHHVLLLFVLLSLSLFLRVLLLAEVIVTHILGGIYVLILFLKCSNTKGLEKQCIIIVLESSLHLCVGIEG